MISYDLKKKRIKKMKENIESWTERTDDEKLNMKRKIILKERKKKKGKTNLSMFRKKKMKQKERERENA